MDVSTLTNTANQSAATQSQNAQLLLNKLQGYNAPYQADIAGQVSGAQDATKELGNQYVADTTHASDALGSSLSDSLNQRIMQANQGATQQLKESLAATGGLERGGADAAFAGNAANTMNQISQGQQGITQQQLAARLGAMGTAYGNNNSMIGTGLGLNTGATNTVLGNNIDEQGNYYNGLNNIEQTRANNVLGAQTLGINSDLASTAASNQATGALLGSTIGAAGTVVGGMYGGPMGAAAGSKLGTVAGSSLGRGTVQSA